MGSFGAKHAWCFQTIGLVFMPHQHSAFVPSAAHSSFGLFESMFREGARKCATACCCGYFDLAPSFSDSGYSPVFRRVRMCIALIGCADRINSLFSHVSTGHIFILFDRRTLLGRGRGARSEDRGTSFWVGAMMYPTVVNLCICAQFSKFSTHFLGWRMAHE